MKMNTAIMFSPRFKTLVSTKASGMTRRGNWVLRTIPSLSTTEVSACCVDSVKKVNSMMLKSRRTA